MLAGVHERRPFWPSVAHLVGDMAEGFMGILGVGLEEGLTQDDCGHGVLWSLVTMGHGHCASNERGSAARWRP
jgi:hypothetical protein